MDDQHDELIMACGPEHETGIEHEQPGFLAMPDNSLVHVADISNALDCVRIVLQAITREDENS